MQEVDDVHFDKDDEKTPTNALFSLSFISSYSCLLFGWLVFFFEIAALYLSGRNANFRIVIHGET